MENNRQKGGEVKMHFHSTHAAAARKALNVQKDKCSMCKRMGWTRERCGKDVLPYTESFSHHPPIGVKSQHIIKLPENLKNNRWKREWF